ncbi:MAG TPA: glycosyltransferase family 2 protein [Pyrinomonadaceae bacterium]|nr:glycosyltransferase family 2 protein [Pyrinomonadaceae bacterium]
MKNLKIEIVTPVYNRRELTLQFLRSLRRINRDGLDVHIIVVDDGSTDGTSEAVAKDFPEVQIVSGNGNLWYTGGTNLGIKAALENNADYILCVNNDSIFEENCLKNMVECAEKHQRSVVGALLLLWNEPHSVFQVSPEWKTSLGGWRHWYQQTVWSVPQKPWQVDIIVGNCVLYPAKVIREVGLMNEKKFAQYGDAEYTPRMRRKGWKLLIEPSAKIFCKPNDVPPKLSAMPFKKLVNTLFFEPHNVHSIKRLLNMNIYGAPSKIEGLIAFVIFWGRVALRKNKLKSKESSEKPLSEIFADKILNE